MPRPRTATLEDRPHAVAPVVMLTPGAHRGSLGMLNYTAEELHRTAALWNGRPVVVYHPGLYQDSYAGSPEVHSKQRVGVIFNARTDSRGRLTAEAWVDLDRAERIDPRVAAALRSGTAVEVSTGLYFDADGVPGYDHRGITYEATATNYRPDHLAILPDQRGACSLADGCGLMRGDAT